MAKNDESSPRAAARGQQAAGAVYEGPYDEAEMHTADGAVHILKIGDPLPLPADEADKWALRNRFDDLSPERVAALAALGEAVAPPEPAPEAAVEVEAAPDAPAAEEGVTPDA